MKIETIAQSWRPPVQFRAPSGALIDFAASSSNGMPTRTLTKQDP